MRSSSFAVIRSSWCCSTSGLPGIDGLEVGRQIGGAVPVIMLTARDEEADRLARLVADLLELARFGRSDFSVAREPVDLAGVVEEAVERPLPRARDVGVELSAAGLGNAWGLGDHDRILQAVSNLIENALRNHPRGRSSGSTCTGATAASGRSAPASGWRSSRS
jgi:signal transduction histidine kinase